MLIKSAVNRLARILDLRIVRVETLNRLMKANFRVAAENCKPSQQSVSHAHSEENLSAQHFHDLGIIARVEHDDVRAFKMFARAISLIPRFEPSRDELRVMSRECLARLTPAMASQQRLLLLAHALEMDPINDAIRRDLEQAHVDRASSDPDLTQMCFIFYDGARARQIHEEAYKRALEFVTLGGVVGDIMEFGVLGGWSARIFSEIMRDIFNLNSLHLFDSFESSPEYASIVDQESYEIGGRNIWADKMRFLENFLMRLGNHIIGIFEIACLRLYAQTESSFIKDFIQKRLRTI